MLRRAAAAAAVRPLPRCCLRALTSRADLHALLELAPDTPREDLRRAYLAALLETHPDHSQSSNAVDRLILLREAWESYRARAPAARDGDPGFTDFGVGCSFSDSEEEQRARAVLQEEASRGRMNQRGLSERSGDRSSSE